MTLQALSPNSALAAFGVVSVANILGEIYIWQTREKEKALIFRYLTKPLLMPLLGVFYYLSTGVFEDFIMAGIIAGCLGDILLMRKMDESKVDVVFLGGMFFFWGGHVLYIFGVWNMGESYASELGALGSAIRIFPFALAALFLIQKYFPLAKDMAPAVAVYACTIMLLGILASILLQSKDVFHSGCIFGGVMLFICSDTILAEEIFGKQSKGVIANPLVMPLYILAQTLIVYGSIGFRAGGLLQMMESGVGSVDSC